MKRMSIKYQYKCHKYACSHKYAHFAIDLLNIGLKVKFIPSRLVAEDSLAWTIQTDYMLFVMLFLALNLNK